MIDASANAATQPAQGEGSRPAPCEPTDASPTATPTSAATGQRPDADRLRATRLSRATLVGLGFQATYALSQFVILSLLYQRLDEAVFGVWVTLFGASIWIMVGNVGIGPALMTRLGRAAYHDPAEAAAVLAAAVRISLVGSIVLAVALGGTVALNAWPPWLNATAPAAADLATPLAALMLGLAILNLPMTLGGVALQAVQRGDLAFSSQWVAQLIGLGGFVAAAWSGASLLTLTAWVMAVPVAAGLMNWGIGRFGGLLPRGPAAPTPAAHMAGAEVDKAGVEGAGVEGAGVYRAMLKQGAGFLLVQLGLALLMQAGPLVLSHVRAPEAVAPYAAVHRLAGLYIVACLTAGLALWPAVADAHRAGRWHAASGLIQRVALGLIGLWAIFALAVFVMGGAFVRWWLGEAAVPSTGLMTAGLAFALAHGLCLTLSAVLNGRGVVWTQARVIAAAAAVFITLASGLGWLAGATGVFAAQATTATLLAAAMLLLLARSLRNEADATPPTGSDSHAPTQAPATQGTPTP